MIDNKENDSSEDEKKERGIELKDRDRSVSWAKIGGITVVVLVGIVTLVPLILGILRNPQSFLVNIASSAIAIALATVTLTRFTIIFSTREQKNRILFKKELDESLSTPLTESELEQFRKRYGLSLDPSDKKSTTTDSQEQKDQPTSTEQRETRQDQQERRIEKSLGMEKYNLLGHLKFISGQIKEYYDISKKQAEKSFRAAIFFSLAGFLLVAFPVIGPAIPSLSSSSSNIVAPGLIAGAIVELFAGTLLFVYRQSLAQMNIYHEALADYHRYLSCVNLAGQLSPKKQDAMYEEIIRTELSKSLSQTGEKPNSRRRKSHESDSTAQANNNPSKDEGA